MDIEDVALGGFVGLILSMLFGDWLPKKLAAKKDKEIAQVEEVVEEQVSSLATN